MVLLCETVVVFKDLYFIQTSKLSNLTLHIYMHKVLSTVKDSVMLHANLANIKQDVTSLFFSLLSQIK